MSEEEKTEPKMNLKFLKKLCRQQQLYSTPELNDALFLTCQAFTEIGPDIALYSGCKSLHLGSNAIQRVEHLGAMTELRSLFLQQNCLESLDGLEELPELRSLNVSNNQLRKVHNLGSLEHLETFMAGHNRFKNAEAVEGLAECPSITVLDLQSCGLEDAAAVTDVVAKLPNLKVLYLMGNPCVSKIKNYRRTLISSVPTLTYLDQRPVFPEERRMAEAWARGGRDAERAERDAIRQEKRDKEERNFLAFRKMVDEGRLKMEAERAARGESSKAAAGDAGKVEGAPEAADEQAEAGGEDTPPPLEAVTPEGETAAATHKQAPPAQHEAAASDPAPAKAAPPAVEDPNVDLLTALD